MCIGLAACGASTRPPAPVTRDARVDELVRTRCSLDGRETITTWTGTVYAFGTGEAPRALFGVAGMNVARCLRDGATWHLTSRELMLYLDPATGAPLARWANPFTGATVPVVHVANARVQSTLAGAPVAIADGIATFVLDIPIAYPNPLAADPATRAYSPAARYEAGEMFTLAAPADAVTGDAPTVPWLQLSWHRVGPWLPWMAMGDRPGWLVYSAHGRKVAGVDELPPVLRDVIRARVPLYAHAPRCVEPGKNVTSWTYFAAHLADYEAGAVFPVPELASSECDTAQR